MYYYANDTVLAHFDPSCPVGISCDALAIHSGASADDATTFSSAEFQLWCHQRGIKHLTGAPYHLATNGAGRTSQNF